MKNWPKISIVTPSYNSANLIELTIQSILDQQYPNLDYIIIDGGSTDDTVEIIKKYRNSLNYWYSGKDNGQYDAINKGMSNASGEILCWLNADDMLLPRSLFIVAEIFDQLKDVEWISTLRPGIWDANSYLAKVGLMQGFSKDAFLDGLFLPGTNRVGYWIQQESTFWRRSLWEKVGSNVPDYKLAGDFALWCEFFKHTLLYGVDYPLGGFRTIKGQRSEDMTSYVAEARNALDKLRGNSNWNGAFMRGLNFTRLAQIPKINSLLFDKYSYSGLKICNKALNTIGAEWEIMRYKFFPKVVN